MTGWFRSALVQNYLFFSIFQKKKSWKSLTNCRHLRCLKVMSLIGPSILIDFMKGGIVQTLSLIILPECSWLFNSAVVKRRHRYNRLHPPPCHNTQSSVWHHQRLRLKKKSASLSLICHTDSSTILLLFPHLFSLLRWKHLYIVH